MPSFRGTLTLACGRARANVASVSPASISAAGMRRRRRPRPGGERRRAPGRRTRAAGPMPAAASRRCRRRAMARSTAMPIGMRTSSSSAAGQMKVTPAASVGAEGPPCARWRATRSSSVESGMASTPARANARAISTSRATAAAANRLRKARSEVSTTSCSPVSASSTSNGPTSGSAASRGSVRRMARTSWRRLMSSSSRSQPGWLMKSEMTKTSDRRRIQRRPDRSSSVRSVIGALAWRGCSDEVADEPQDLVAAGACRDDPFDLTAIEDGADPVAVARQDARQRGDDIDEHGPLVAIVGGRPEVDRRAEVEQEPRRQLAILVVLADVRRRQTCGHVPVDVPDVIAELVLAQAGEVDAVAAEEAPIVALEEAVQSADDLPVEVLEDALRRYGGRRTAPGGGRRGCARRRGWSSAAGRR